MIEYAMLIMLGFFAGGLVAVLIAPTLWNRAVRLTTRRLEATMPMSLSDIEADKDLLRASYAVEMRRLETALEKGREKSAGQLVEISKLQMEIGSQRERIEALQHQLDERSNAANVFEKTVKKRLPELDAQLTAARAALDEHASEIADLSGKLRRKEEAVALAQQSAALQLNELRQLRDGLEASGADRTGRFKKRPAEWTLEEFRSEYDRLNAELSKMREQLALTQERENRESEALKSEMQQLAERLMSSAAARAKQEAAAASIDIRGRDVTPPARDTAPRRQRRDEKPLAAPKPWPNEANSEKLSSENTSGKDANPPSERQKLTSKTELKQVHAVTQIADESGQERGVVDMTTKNSAAISAHDGTLRAGTTDGAAAGSAAGATGTPRRSFSRMSMNAPITEGNGHDAGKGDTRAALKTLLARTPAAVERDENGQAPSLAAIFGAPQAQETAQEVNGVPAGPEAIPAGMSLASLMAQAAVSDVPADSTEHVSTGAGEEGQMDRVLREIFESHSAAAAAHDKSGAPAAAAALEARAESQPGGDEGAKSSALLDRLRLMKGRQTG